MPQVNDKSDPFHAQLQEIARRNSISSEQKSTEELRREKEEFEYKVRENIRMIIPRRYRSIEFKDMGLVKRSLGKNLFVTGGSGTGKTVFACSVAKELIRHRFMVKFINYPGFIMELKDAFRREGGEPYRMTKALARYPGFLVIDDLGAENLTDFVAETTYFILNEREQWHLPILITSNFSLEEFNKQVDARISSRIAGMCEILKFKGKDLRVEQHALQQSTD